MNHLARSEKSLPGICFFVVFPCDHMDPDGDTVNVYYGAADRSIALARASIRSPLEWLDAKGSSDRRQHQDS
jgi:predicted GH43/DUF377 family glycosyl hydrolase